MAAATRQLGLVVQDFLDKVRSCAHVYFSDRSPFYLCDIIGEERSAFSTLVTYEMSRAFVEGRAGAIYDSNPK